MPVTEMEAMAVQIVRRLDRGPLSARTRGAMLGFSPADIMRLRNATLSCFTDAQLRNALILLNEGNGRRRGREGAITASPLP